MEASMHGHRVVNQLLTFSYKTTMTHTIIFCINTLISLLYDR